MSPRDRRAVIVGAALVSATLLAVRGIPWAAVRVARLDAATHDRLATRERAREALAGSAAERDSLARVLSRVVQFAPRLVEGHSSAEAQASLSGLLSLAASRHAVTLSRVQPVPDSAAGTFVRVSVAAQGESDVRGLAALLRAIETTETLLTVRELGMQALDQSQRSTLPERLRIELAVSGWYLPRREP